MKIFVLKQNLNFNFLRTAANVFLIAFEPWFTFTRILRNELLMIKIGQLHISYTATQKATNTTKRIQIAGNSSVSIRRY